MFYLKKRFYLFSLLLVFSFIPLAAKSYSRDYFVPEPLYFDLVRNLGAKKGELEINALSKIRKKDTAVVSPEIEYAFADNHAIELELPLEGENISEVKAGYQATFGTLGKGNYMHGFQTIAEMSIHDYGYTVSALYLSAWKLNETVSFLFMNGYQNFTGMSFLESGVFDDSDKTGQNKFLPQKIKSDRYLFNGNVFFDLNETWILGMEFNLRTNFKNEKEHLFLPNVKYHLTKNTSIHAGAGWNKELESPGYTPIVVLRAILEI